MIELESHAKAKKSELPLGMGDPEMLVADYTPKTGLLSLQIASGEKHNYVLICSVQDWLVLVDRIASGIDMMQGKVPIPPKGPERVTRTQEPDPVDLAMKTMAYPAEQAPMEQSRVRKNNEAQQMELAKTVEQSRASNPDPSPPGYGKAKQEKLPAPPSAAYKEMRPTPEPGTYTETPTVDESPLPPHATPEPGQGASMWDNKDGGGHPRDNSGDLATDKPKESEAQDRAPVLAYDPETGEVIEDA